jgi:subtilisin family serine protease
MKRIAVLGVGVLTLVACQDTSQPLVTAPVADLSANVAEPLRTIPGRFIVTLRSGAEPNAVARGHGVAPDFVYTAALNGFAGAVSEAARAGLLQDARVLRIEPDGVVRTVSTSGSQLNPTWGLDRIDQRPTALDGKYTWVHNGGGVVAYIIDTGILASHVDLRGRTTLGFDSFAGTSKDTGGDDCNGHGTHVAGTVGGTTYGVAKNVALVAVRVLDCGGSGSWSGVIAGIDYVAQQKAGNPSTPMVANMSLGGGANTSVDDAVNNLISAGVTTVVAAGNGNQAGRAQDACNYSPARVPDALTIGATDATDTKTSWSNYGNCVDWFAPGRSITSAWIGGDSEIRTISGTSMAAPHTAGVAALYLSQYNAADPATVNEALRSFTTKGVVKSSNTTANHLLFSLAEVDTGSGGGGGGGCRGNKCK